MHIDITQFVIDTTGASGITNVETIQSLWSGYGKILRVRLTGLETESVIVKHVQLPDQASHPRGWNSDRSHQRKVRSYQVETAWYQHWSEHCDNSCRVPHSIAMEQSETGFIMVLEDLNDSGFPVRKSKVSLAEMQHCLDWLANFHATFMGCEPQGLWPKGTYWHLETRPDELAALDDVRLKEAADVIDQRLSKTPYLTFVHGDAKLANFCFSKNISQVAAVDFQYIGAGCGMKDVAYFIGSCLYEEDCEKYEQQLLDSYFEKLHIALQERESTLDFDDLQRNWRELYPFAWTDFHRFMKGWSPGHWKIHGYSERLSREVLAQLEQIKQ